MALQHARRSVRPRARAEKSPRRGSAPGGNESNRSLPRRIGRILGRTGKAFFDDNITRLGAALAFYTTIAVAPLMVLAIAVAGFFFEETFALQIVNNAISFGMLTFLFAMIFKLLPDTPVRWHNVWLGAVVTALLFTIGKSLLGLYFGRADVASGYGAARSLIVLLLWCYYAAQIVFLGAEFTRVTALSRGGRDFSALDEPAEKQRSA